MRKIGKTTKTNPRSTREANAEHLLLQSLALRIGQEAARQHGINAVPYHPLDDPHDAHLSTLQGVGEQPITLRATLTLEVNPKTGAMIGIKTPHPHPRQ